MEHKIYGRIRQQVVVFIGCTRTSDIPDDCVILQIVEHRPEVHWVKWCLRFRGTLTDTKALDHPFAAYFKNSARVRRLCGDEDLSRASADINVQFLKFHEKNPHLLDELVRAALTKKSAGRKEYSVDQILGDARWGATEIDRGDDRVKINATWSSWYSRVAQMVEPELVGFFTVRSSFADDLVWTDGRSWQQFALEHEEEIRWSDPFDQLPDSDWEYQG